MGMDDRIAPTHGVAPACTRAVWVHETRFGRWFLGTEVWRKYVLAEALGDLALCHQVLHHLVPQREALTELHRVLRPGGLLLMSESCRAFIDTGLVRALFRHPRGSQRTADGYLDLVRSAGFRVDDRDAATSSPWWSRRDLGLLGDRDKRRGAQAEEPTEVLCVAVKM